mmetsp:Transcript_56029/g.126427  ORF Transcript_56029/g.126427 Transcript_56029/m.126427 type:complete len:223 (+) Transcript_56029:48-716(+)
MPPKLAKKDAISIQDTLILEYSNDDFQDRLHAAWRAAGDDEVKWVKARQDLCLPIQEPVVSRFGFESSRKGVSQTNAACQALNDDPEVAARNAKLTELVSPNLQPNPRPARIQRVVSPVLAQIPPVAVTSSPDVEPGNGQLWRVMGGSVTGGIVVKMGRDLRSNEAAYRLKHGSTAEQIELVGDRLHYRRIRGDGPDFGWVSVHFRGQTLLTKLGRPREPEE